MAQLPNAFMVNSKYKKAWAIFIPIPFSKTLSYRKGAEKGPNSILKASSVLEGYNVDLHYDLSELENFYTYEEIKEQNIGEIIKKAGNIIKKAIDEKKLPIVLGGEHSVSLATINALIRLKKEFSVIYIDAHADLRDTFNSNKYSHACVARRIWEKNKDIVEIGVRSISTEGAKFAKEKGIQIFNADFNIENILRNTKKDVYISFDIDAIDPSEIPGVGTPEPEGLSYKKAKELLYTISEEKNIIAMDFVELSPIEKDVRSQYLTAKLIYSVLGKIWIKKNKK